MINNEIYFIYFLLKIYNWKLKGILRLQCLYLGLVVNTIAIKLME